MEVVAAVTVVAAAAGVNLKSKTGVNLSNLNLSNLNSNLHPSKGGVSLSNLNSNHLSSLNNKGGVAVGGEVVQVSTPQNT